MAAIRGSTRREDPGRADRASSRSFPGVNFNFSQLIRDNVEEALSGVKGANSVKLFGTDLDTLEEAGQRVANILRTVPGIENVGLFHIVGQPNLEIQIDRDACARYGINVADVEAVVQVADRRPGVFARWSRARSSTTSSCGCPPRLARRPRRHRPPDRSTSPAKDSQPAYRIPLSQLAKIVPHKPGASYIYRENNRRFIPIKFSVRDRDLASAIAEAQRKVDDPDDRRQAAARLPDRLVGRVRPDGAGQRNAALDRARSRSA